MARDYLAIQGSSVASERAFSSGARTGTTLRNRLSPETFEALQIVKDGYKTGLISASEQAEEFAQELLGDNGVIDRILDDDDIILD